MTDPAERAAERIAEACAEVIVDRKRFIRACAVIIRGEAERENERLRGRIDRAVEILEADDTPLQVRCMAARTTLEGKDD